MYWHIAMSKHHHCILLEEMMLGHYVEEYQCQEDNLDIGSRTRLAQVELQHKLEKK